MAYRLMYNCLYRLVYIEHPVQRLTRECIQVTQELIYDEIHSGLEGSFIQGTALSVVWFWKSEYTKGFT